MDSEPVLALLKEIVEQGKYRLASECTAKYQRIVSRLPADLLLHGQTLTFKDWEKESRTIATLHAYVDLCAEELALWNAGQIPEAVWKNWEQGICAGFQIPAVAQIWNNFFTRGPYEDLRGFLESKGLPKVRQ
jgi:hypothetical protein